MAQAGASERVAHPERRRLVRDVETAGLHSDGESWLSKASGQVLMALSDGREATLSELREELPVLAGSIAYGEGKSWGGQMPPRSTSAHPPCRRRARSCGRPRRRLERLPSPGPR